ncbi:MAG TPA: DNA recombination protein RmuC [Dermatophilaceae bacterium]|nr:DNA recombination protein RmuC [Dermatophilaceae bacterium]
MDVSPLVAVVVGLVVGAAGAGAAVQAWAARRLAAAAAEASWLRGRLAEVDRVDGQDRAASTSLASVREALDRVERHVGTLERDRAHQFGQLGERLAEVSLSTGSLRDHTAALAGALNASSVRGAWGENQLRRVLEHSGMLPRCDFDEQVRASAPDGSSVRPDVVVRLPGSRTLVIDAKAPMQAFLAAHADGVDPTRRTVLLRQHAAALRSHVDQLAAKGYWTAFPDAPDLVVCFVPGDAILAAALAADPSLFDDAQAAKVVLACPSTLLALLRAVAFGWKQDAVTSNARELLALGSELYNRLGTLAGHVTRVGSSLRRSVESYNAMIGALESRVLVTARRMHELGLADQEVARPEPLVVADRPLTAAELLDSLTPRPGTAGQDTEGGLAAADPPGSAQTGSPQTCSWTPGAPRTG